MQAALRATGALSKDVADVPVTAVAREAGISRSTLATSITGLLGSNTSPAIAFAGFRRRDIV